MAERFRRVPPGITRLAGLLDEYGEAVESDLIVYCNGTDILDLWRGGLSWRRLGVLIRHLPMESATKTALRNAAPESELRKATGSEYGPWSQTDMLLGELIDGIRTLVYAKTKDSVEGRNPPKPYPRPGVPREGQPSGDADVIDLQVFEQMRANRGGVDGYKFSHMVPAK